MIPSVKGKVRGQRGSKKRVQELEERHDVVRTPFWVLNEMIRIANIQPGEKILDPCAGEDNRIIGHLGNKGILNDSVALENSMVPQDVGNYCQRYQLDFWMGALMVQQRPFDVVIMNPPFSNNQAYLFVEELITNGWLSAKGRIVTIGPNYVLDNGELRKPFLDKYVQGIGFLPKNVFAYGPLDKKGRPTKCKVLHVTVVEYRINRDPKYQWIKWFRKPKDIIATDGAKLL